MSIEATPLGCVTCPSCKNGDGKYQNCIYKKIRGVPVVEYPKRHKIKKKRKRKRNKDDTQEEPKPKRRKYEPVYTALQEDSDNKFETAEGVT